jgi:PHD/YefM family antitoxin component YafN of YafNO toxin-antitoxin module
MSAQSHPCFDVTVVAPALESLHEHITKTRGRLEITRRGSDERCVLISKEELESLEKALAILSDTETVRDICGKIAALAAATAQADYATV